MINLDNAFNVEDQKTFRSYFNIVDSNVISLDEATDICIMEVHDHMHCRMKTGWLIDRLYKEKAVVCVEENAIKSVDQSDGQTAYVKRKIRVLGWDDKDEAKEKESKDALGSDFVKRQQSMVKTLQSNRNAPQRFTIAGAAHFALADKQFTQKLKQAVKLTDAEADALVAELNKAAKPGIDIVRNDLRTRKYVILEGYRRPLTGVAKQKIEKEYAYCKWPTWLDEVAATITLIAALVLALPIYIVGAFPPLRPTRQWLYNTGVNFVREVLWRSNGSATGYL